MFSHAVVGNGYYLWSHNKIKNSSMAKRLTACGKNCAYVAAS